MSSILVTGSHGQLGSEFRKIQSKLSYDWIFTDVAELDITDFNHVQAFFKEQDIAWCINCAAYTQVDKAEMDSAFAFRINEDGAAHLAKACQDQGAKMVQISTDFVFDGQSNVPLSENTPLLPLGIYGKSKMAGEFAVARHLSNHLIFRTSWLYSSFRGNFMKTMLRLGNERGELNVIDDQVGTPTHAADLADAVLHAIKTIDASENPEKFNGTYHYSNEGIASWYDFAVAIMELAGLSTQVNTIPATAYPTPAERPKYSVMSKAKFKKTFDLPVPHWRKSLKACIDILEDKKTL